MIDRTELRARLLAKIKINETTGCWDWTASTDTSGYGHLKVGGRVRLAHRTSYEVHRGPVGGMHVCHRCDNPICINPNHLFLGTWRDNMLDKLAKGRQSRSSLPGERHPMAKLSADDIRAIRAAKNVMHADLAKQYGVARAHITQIINGKRWGHIY